MKEGINKISFNVFDKLKKDKSQLLFIILQLIMYISFMSLDIINYELYQISNLLKFSSIVLCFLYVSNSLKHRMNKRDSYILLFAMFFTMISDWFILIRDSYTLGLVTFIIVQFLYFIRIHVYNKTRYAFMLVIRNGIISTFVIFIMIKNNIKLEMLLSLAIVYFITFLFNIFDSSIIFIKHRKKEFSFFLLGLVLFSLCDINVGLYNLMNFIQVNHKLFETIYSISFLGMWFFYLPSQVILSISEINS